MCEPITLRGITWNHPRGLDPLLAANDVYRERGARRACRVDDAIPVRLRRGSPDRARGVVRPSRHRSPVRRRRRGEHGLPSARYAGRPRRPPRTEPGECRAESRELRLRGSSMGASPSTPPRRSRRSTSASAGDGMPATWDEVFALAATLRRDGRWMAVPMWPADLCVATYTIGNGMGLELFADGRVFPAGPRPGGAGDPQAPVRRLASRRAHVEPADAARPDARRRRPLLPDAVRLFELFADRCAGRSRPVR